MNSAPWAKEPCCKAGWWAGAGRGGRRVSGLIWLGCPHAHLFLLSSSGQVVQSCFCCTKDPWETVWVPFCIPCKSAPKSSAPLLPRSYAMGVSTHDTISP